MLEKRTVLAAPPWSCGACAGEVPALWSRCSCVPGRM